VGTGALRGVDEMHRRSRENSRSVGVVESQTKLLVHRRPLIQSLSPVPQDLLGSKLGWGELSCCCADGQNSSRRRSRVVRAALGAGGAWGWMAEDGAR
jgi:hypothetical protein